MADRVARRFRRLFRKKHKDDDLGADLFWPDEHEEREHVRNAFVRFLAELRHQGIRFTRYVRRAVTYSENHRIPPRTSMLKRRWSPPTDVLAMDNIAHTDDNPSTSSGESGKSSSSDKKSKVRPRRPIVKQTVQPAHRPINKSLGAIPKSRPK